MEVRPSSNFDARPSGRAPDMIVLHYTGMPSADASLARLCDPAARVSAHYLIDEAGVLTRIVLETMRAWHAGSAFWRGEEDINGCSIGIELQNPGHAFGYRPFPDAQIVSLISLCRDIRSRFAVPDARILAHSDVAPGRKQDPGELFPWRRLAGAGIGLWPDETIDVGSFASVSESSTVLDIKRLQGKLDRFGYRVTSTGTYDPATRQAVLAFKRHWAPERLDDEADATTVGILENLLKKIGSAA